MICILCSANTLYVRFGANEIGADGSEEHPYPTINGALTGAQTIVDCIIDIGPGIYEERLSISGRNSSLELRSHYSETLNNYSVIEQTVIQADTGEDSYSAVYLGSNTGNITIWGLTITGGRLHLQDGLGSGIHIVNNNGQVSISHCVISNNSALKGGGIYATGTNVYLSKSVISENYLASSDQFPIDHSGGGIYQQYGILSIVDCRISGNEVGTTVPLYDIGHAGGIWYSTEGQAGSYIEIIRSEICFNKTTASASAIWLGFNVSSGWETSRIENCVIYGNHNSSLSDGAALVISSAQPVPSFEGGIKNCVIRENTYGPLHSLSNRQVWSSNLPYPILKHCVTHRFADIGWGIEYYGEGNLYVDPRFVDAANGDFHLAWDENGPSPCIDAGYPGENNELTDTDGTPPDIGCVYYPHYNHEYFSWQNASGIEWMSFPVLDDRTYLDEEHWNELGYMFESNMENPPNSPLDQIQWSYYGSFLTMTFVNNDWSYTIEQAIQPKGYKVKFNTGMSVAPVDVNGFKANPDTTPAAWVRVVEDVNGQVVPFENWIGYFVPFTQKAGDALSRLLPGSLRDKYLDYVHTIKTQSWGTSRISEQPGSPWIIDPNIYTLSEGEMVALLLLTDAPDEMYWSAITNPVPPIEKPPATAFSFEEKLDYTSVFIEFDPTDMPDEVGVYVDGVCKGAAVVDSSLIDVCFYNDTAKDGTELEILFYYDGKGKKAAKGWTTYNPDTMVFENSGIDVNNIGNYAYISFKSGEGDSPVPLMTSLQPNFPNPFNPSTNISFILGKDMAARLEIYNLRGQRVKTLCKTQLTKGKHTLLWNGQDDHGRQVSSGIYFSRLSTPEGSYTQKMMLMK